MAMYQHQNLHLLLVRFDFQSQGQELSDLFFLPWAVNTQRIRALPTDFIPLTEERVSVPGAMVQTRFQDSISTAQIGLYYYVLYQTIELLMCWDFCLSPCSQQIRGPSFYW